MANKAKSNDLIKVDNRFAEMHFKYTQEEMDILFYVMSIIRTDTTEYRFAVSDIEKVSGKKINNVQFRESILSLAKRPYEKFLSDDKWETFFVFKSIRYDNGSIRLSLNEEVVPLLCDLKANYTQLQLASGFRLNGKYSKRLYLLMCRWRNLGGKIYEIDEIANILKFEMKDGDRSNVGNFKKMLTRAANDINSNTDIFLEAKWIKTGRNTTHVNFLIRKGKVREDDMKRLSDPELGKMKALLMPCGIPELLVERLYSEGCHFAAANMVHKQALKAISNGTRVDMPGAYLLQCFRQKGYLMSDEERNTKIRVYREMIENGAEPETLRPVLDRLGIFIEEVMMK